MYIQYIHTQSAMWYIISLFLRSKTYIESVCPDFVDTNMSRFMLACMELPMLTYLITSFLSIYDKSAFHLMLSVGMFVCVFVVWIMDFIFPQLGSDGAPCVYDNRGYACEECAVVWFVFVFMSCHILLMHKRRGSIWSVINYMCLLGVYAFMAVFAQVYIGLFSFNQTVIGSCIGIVVGTAYALCVYVFLTPHFNEPFVQWLLSKCGVYTCHYRGPYSYKYMRTAINN